MSLLEALQDVYRKDPTLTFPHSCRIGKCGSCTVRLNGNPVLACRYIVDNAEEFVLEPIANFPVDKDLLVDRSPFERTIIESLALFGNIQNAEWQPEGLLRDFSVSYKSLTECVECLACDSICPVLRAAPDLYFGPANTATMAGPGPRLQSRGGEDRGVPVPSNIDYCAFCLNCELVCPANIPFQRLNAATKDAYFAEKGRPLHDEVTGRIGMLAKTLSHVPAAGSIQRSRIAKVLLDWLLEFDQRMDLPTFSSANNSWVKQPHPSSDPRPRVAFFVGCFARYIDTEVGRLTAEVLEHNGITVRVPDQQCCGMPMLSKGDLAGAKRLGEQNIKAFQSLVDEGYDIISACTSCSWMLKKGYTVALQMDEARRVAAHAYDLGEYLLKLKRLGRLDTDFKPVTSSLVYHAPCHLRSQKIGTPFLEILRAVPGLALRDETKTCCGLAGTYGFKKGKYEVAAAVGLDLFKAIQNSGATVAISECGTCRLQIAHGTSMDTDHPVSILHSAYFGEVN
jgi:glycerol-3-phosphate dehydrogenase subunit C